LLAVPTEVPQAPAVRSSLWLAIRAAGEYAAAPNLANRARMQGALDGLRHPG
jgi:hypothetical protein